MNFKTILTLVFSLGLLFAVPQNLNAQIKIGKKLDKIKKLKDKVKKPKVNDKVGGVTTKIPKKLISCETREGANIYALEYPIFAGNSDRLPHMIEYIEVTETSTIVHFVSYGDWAMCFGTIGTDKAPYLYWNGSNEVGMNGGNGERFEVIAYHGMESEKEGVHCATLSHYAIEFARIPNYVCKFNVVSPSSVNIQGQTFWDIKLDPNTKVDRAVMDALVASQKSSFQGDNIMAVAQTRTFTQRYLPEETKHEWTVEGNLEIVGSTTGNTVQVKALKSGAGKVCLKADYGTDVGECSSCKEINVIKPEEKIPFFDMTNCGKFMPRWGFSILEESRVEGTVYTWEVYGSLPSQTSKEEIKEVRRTIQGTGPEVTNVRPAIRETNFTIKVTAKYPDGSEVSHERSFHDVFDCPDKNSRYWKRSLGLEK